MRVGFFGGTFDPPHRGHLLLAQTARERCRLQRVLLAPTARQPLKPAGHTAAFADRLAMVPLLCGHDGAGSLSPSALDGPRADGELNYTVDALRALRATLAPEDTIFVITGADAFLDLRRWREPEQLLQLAEWIVISRPGAFPEQMDRLGLTPGERQRVHWIGDVFDPVSATEVRARLAAGQDCEGLVPGPVLAYIREHALYTGAPAR